MENNVNKVIGGFRFPANLYAHIYVAEPTKGITVRLMLLREDENTTLQMDILQEVETGLMRIMARRLIPCTVDDDDYLLGLDDNFNIPLVYRTVMARFQKNPDGQIELQIKHTANNEIVIDRFTA